MAASGQTTRLQHGARLRRRLSHLLAISHQLLQDENRLLKQRLAVLEDYLHTLQLRHFAEEPSQQRESSTE